MSVPAERAGAALTVDLDAVVANWRQLSALCGPAACSAVVKADAYGLGAAEVSAALHEAGCGTFFVAHAQEGLELRQALGPRPQILVLNGTPAGTQEDFVASALVPVVNTRRELAAWRAHAASAGTALPVALQVDSGMSRLGLPPKDVAAIARDGALLDGLETVLVMSHLACADEPRHPANEAQRREFERLRAMLPAAPASLANSSGIFLGKDFHFDLARPGAALYGINPVPGANPMRRVVGLEARVIQLREVGAGTGIGYGHAASAARPSRLATISLGYADGWPRNAAAAATFRGTALPFVGRVSMDSIVLDVTNCPEPPQEGDVVEFLGPGRTVDDVAAAAGTIGYEILTRLGRRFHRRHLRPAGAPPRPPRSPRHSNRHPKET